jgi:hypothetical protein
LQALVPVQLKQHQGLYLVLCHCLMLAGDFLCYVLHEGAPLAGFDGGFHVTYGPNDPLFNRQWLVAGSQCG